MKQRREADRLRRLSGATDVVKVSAIGIGMRSHAGVAARAFKALADKGINIRAITTSEIKFSMLIDAGLHETGGAHAARALRAHAEGVSAAASPRLPASR